jgi:hypothetical protein
VTKREFYAEAMLRVLGGWAGKGNGASSWNLEPTDWEMEGALATIRAAWDALQREAPLPGEERPVEFPQRFTEALTKILEEAKRGVQP